MAQLRAEPLKVKFNWNLRKRQSLTCEKDQTPKSTTAKYMRKLQDTNPDKYEHYKAVDRERAKQKYTKIENVSNVEKENMRSKWATQKKIQRERKRIEKEQHTKIRYMTQDERRVYWAKNKRSQRKQQKTKAETYRHTMKKVSGKSTSMTTSKATFYRKLNTIKKNMPKSPKSYADIIHTLSTKTSPRKRIAVRRNKPVKRSLGGVFSGLGEKSDSSRNEKAGTYRLKKSTKIGNGTAKYLLAKALLASRLRYRDANQAGISKRIYSNVKKGISGRKYRTGLKESTIQSVKDYWYSITRPMPLKKRVKNKTPLFLLECSYTTAYKNYRKLYPNISIGYVKFIHLKPSNVRLLKAKERIVCCCMKCENVKCTIGSLNNTAVKVGLSGLRVDTERDISDLTLCAYDSFPKKDCIERKCNQCGITKVAEYYKPLLDKCGNDEIKVNKWKNVHETKTVKNEEKKVTSVQLVTANKSVKDTVEDMSSQVKDISSHLFRAKWQQHMFGHIKEHTPPKTAVMVLDFAENYACAMQDEVQSHHWALDQVTIHPIVAFVNVSNTTGPATHIESDIFISNDRKHDAAAVQLFTEQCVEKHREKFGITRVIEYTDCCAGQYRGKTAFRDLSLLSEIVNIERNYFESSHGKSSADGISAVVKSAATKAVTNRQSVIRNAKEFHEFCEGNIANVGDCIFPSERAKYKHSNREFHYVEGKDIQAYREKPGRDITTVKGTMKVHCIKACRPYEIQIREISCFCNGCMSDDKTCENREFVSDWRPVKLASSRSNAQLNIAETPTSPTKLATQQMVEKDTPTDSLHNPESLDPELLTGETPAEEGDYLLVNLTSDGKSSRTKQFVAQVLSTDQVRMELQLSYMEEKQKNQTLYFMWPKVKDISWENMSVVARRLQPPSIDEKASNKRLTYYKFSVLG